MREAIEDQRKRQRQQEDGDVIVEYPLRLMLRSPHGTFWAVTVDDSGALSTVNMGTSL